MSKRDKQQYGLPQALGPFGVESDRLRVRSDECVFLTALYTFCGLKPSIRHSFTCSHREATINIYTYIEIVLMSHTMSYLSYSLPSNYMAVQITVEGKIHFIVISGTNCIHISSETYKQRYIPFLLHGLPLSFVV